MRPATFLIVCLPLLALSRGVAAPQCSCCPPSEVEVEIQDSIRNALVGTPFRLEFNKVGAFRTQGYLSPGFRDGSFFLRGISNLEEGVEYRRIIDSKSGIENGIQFFTFSPDQGDSGSQTLFFWMPSFDRTCPDLATAFYLSVGENLPQTISQPWRIRVSPAGRLGIEGDPTQSIALEFFTLRGSRLGSLQSQGQATLSLPATTSGRAVIVTGRIDGKPFAQQWMVPRF